MTNSENKPYDGEMFVHKILCLFISSLFAIHPLFAIPLAEEFERVGYLEISNTLHGREAFDSLYAEFDAFIRFLQTNPTWAHKLYSAKERFIRSKERDYYSTDFCGFYDESTIKGLISFYYSTHFHAFIWAQYPECKTVPEIDHFFAVCLEMQKPYKTLFNETANALGLDLFSSQVGEPPLLFKVVKYLPSYSVSRPHYDGTAFSLFLDSTDNQSLLLSPYKSSFISADFSSPSRSENSILLIPGVFLTEFSIYPTPHIAAQSGNTRYATIAFAMRPHFVPEKIALSSLPSFKQNNKAK